MQTIQTIFQVVGTLHTKEQWTGFFRSKFTYEKEKNTYGIEVPTTNYYAKINDDNNKNRYWKDTTDKEMFNI